MDNLNQLPDLKTLELNEGGLVIKFDFGEVEKVITFAEHYAFRYIAEGDALNILNEQNFDGASWLFVNEESDLSIWFNSQSYNIHKDQYKSYAFVSHDDIIEVLSKYSPTIG